MTKHLLLILVLIIGCCSPSFAQKHDGKKGENMMKELREFKVKFIAQEIDLKEDQKARFVELYNEMCDKRVDAMRDAWKMERELKKNKDATEADYQAVTDAMTKAKAKDAAIEKDYDEQFAKFLTQKQIFKMKEAENEFRKKMSEMRHKHGKKGNK
ncbi:MAG: hypothetical protein K2H60_08805 [Muribaculaceae bacterium]|nr:hypothetical protein [Muribaculaceae bacterium]